MTTRHCATFLRNNWGDKPNSARKYAGVLRKMFRYSISELGLRERNPCEELDLSDYETQRREIDMAPAHNAVAKIRAAALTGEDGLPTESGPMFQCIIDMAYLCWQRAIDVRVLRETADRRRPDPLQAVQDEEQQWQGCRHRDHTRHQGRYRQSTRDQEKI